MICLAELTNCSILCCSFISLSYLDLLLWLSSGTVGCSSVLFLCSLFLSLHLCVLMTAFLISFSFELLWFFSIHFFYRMHQMAYLSLFLFAFCFALYLLCHFLFCLLISSSIAMSFFFFFDFHVPFVSFLLFLLIFVCICFHFVSISFHFGCFIGSLLSFFLLYLFHLVYCCGKGYG